MEEIIKFLCGEGEMDGVSFGVRPANQPPFWWRKKLRDAYNAASQQTASLREENQRLKNDLLDALDVKQGNGPTALSILKEENKLLREALEKCDKTFGLIDRIHTNLKEAQQSPLLGQLVEAIEIDLPLIQAQIKDTLTQLSTTNGKVHD